MIRRLGRHTDVRGLLADATEEGRDPVVVDAGATKEATLAAFRDALHLPGWFGMNLDALADSLEDWAAEQEGERELVWDHVGVLRAADPDTAGVVEDILDDTQQAHPRLTCTLVER